jgi:hypothetical protein
VNSPVPLYDETPSPKPVPDWFNQDNLNVAAFAIAEALAGPGFMWQVVELEGTQVAVGCHHYQEPDGSYVVGPLFALLTEGDLFSRITTPEGAEPLTETKETDDRSPDTDEGGVAR